MEEITSVDAEIPLVGFSPRMERVARVRWTPKLVATKKTRKVERVNTHLQTSQQTRRGKKEREERSRAGGVHT